MDARGIKHSPLIEPGKIPQELERTPIAPISVVVGGMPRRIYLKLEGENPTGSVKYRTACSLINTLESRKVLNKSSIVVESTSGNLGVALSYLCKMRGYQFVAVIDPKTTQENIAKMQAFGAELDLVDQPDQNGGYLLSRLAHIRELCERSDAYIWTDQYSNPANPLIHYLSTGPEIYDQMQAQVDAVFVAVSTGGTLAGIGRFFREVSPSTAVIGVDAHGSVVFGTPAGPRKLTGIGSSRASSFITPNLYDAHMLVKDEEAFAFCRALWDKTAIKVGGSSGAVLAACAKYLLDHPEARNVVCVCADTGDNYSNSIFSDAWLQEHGLHLSQDYLRLVENIQGDDHAFL